MPAVAILLSSCGIPRLHQADHGRDLPETFNGLTSSENSSQIGVDEFFDDPALTNLIDQALVGSLQLKILNQDIEIANNRRTPDRGDDLILYIANGPLRYAEKDQTIVTDDTVHMIDLQSKPKPVEVWGKGMRVELLAEAPAPKPGQVTKKKQQESISGVKSIALCCDVEMTLYVDGQSGKEPHGLPNFKLVGVCRLAWPVRARF